MGTPIPFGQYGMDTVVAQVVLKQPTADHLFGNLSKQKNFVSVIFGSSVIQSSSVHLKQILSNSRSNGNLRFRLPLA